MRSDGLHTDAELEAIVSLYENGFKEIQSILVDGDDLTAEEQLDSIADIVFDDQGEEE